MSDAEAARHNAEVTARSVAAEAERAKAPGALKCPACGRPGVESSAGEACLCASCTNAALARFGWGPL